MMRGGWGSYRSTGPLYLKFRLRAPRPQPHTICPRQTVQFFSSSLSSIIVIIFSSIGFSSSVGPVGPRPKDISKSKNIEIVYLITIIMHECASFAKSKCNLNGNKKPRAQVKIEAEAWSTVWRVHEPRSHSTKVVWICFKISVNRLAMWSNNNLFDVWFETWCSGQRRPGIGKSYYLIYWLQ